MDIETSNYTITHLLGYLTAEKWVDALQHKLNRELVEELLKVQDATYPGSIKTEVEELLKEKGLQKLLR